MKSILFIVYLADQLGRVCSAVLGLIEDLSSCREGLATLLTKNFKITGKNLTQT